jgi:biotin carboxyl carrier protein
MGAAKVVSLSARPWKASQLCFEVGGILGEIDIQLGATVTPFDFTTFYSGLGATVAGDLSLLSFNSAGILSAPSVTASILAALRAEPRKAALDMAVNARQNAYFAKYSNMLNTVAQANNFYGGATWANPARLENLANYAQSQATQLANAYSTDGRPVVVMNTSSALNSKTFTTDSSKTTPNITNTTTPNLTTQETGQSNQQTIGATNFPSMSFSPEVPKGAARAVSIAGGGVSDFFEEGTSGATSIETGKSIDIETGTETSTGQAYAVETESIVNTDYTYRIPSIECQAQNERAQISLNDQRFALFMATQNLPNLLAVLQNELNSIDRSVYQLQVAFLNTILLSPIAGTVTGIYKNPGDPVRAGEPVVRVEDNSTLFLVARLIYRGQIQNGSSVAVTTNLFDESGPHTPLNGSVVAVRNCSEDDLWDLVVQCPNPSLIFPIGYHFDYDPSITTVTIT